MGIAEIHTWLSSCCEFAWDYLSWENIKVFGNSNFFTALVGSLAGAFAGAYIAQRIAERDRGRGELLKEIRNTNAAIMVSFSICNSTLSLKKQHVKGLKDGFDSSRTQLEEHQKKHQAGAIQGNMLYRLTADLQTLPRPQLPTGMLQNQVFEKLSVGGRPLSLVTSLLEATIWLNGSITKRNELIEQYKTTSAVEDPEFYSLYLGLPYKGHVNLDYPNTIDAIYSYTDDVIFFSHLLCKDLNNHGEQLAAKFKRKFGKGAPRISEADFGKARSAGLLPKDENYTDWLSAFIKKDSQKMEDSQEQTSDCKQ